MNESSYNQIFLFLAWNIIVFLLYGIDKRNAKEGKWRISNQTLLSCAVLLGGVGALLGMYVFRHKTKTKLFQIIVPLGALISLILGYYLILR